MNVVSKQKPTYIVIPDLVSHCTFAMHLNPHVERAAAESKDWLFEHGNLSEKRKDAFRGLKAGGRLIFNFSEQEAHPILQN